MVTSFKIWVQVGDRQVKQLLQCDKCCGLEEKHLNQTGTSWEIGPLKLALRLRERDSQGIEAGETRALYEKETCHVQTLRWEFKLLAPETAQEIQHHRNITYKLKDGQRQSQKDEQVSDLKGLVCQTKEF